MSSKYKNSLPLDVRIKKLNSKFATNAIRHYLTSTPFEWSLIENEFYKEWVYSIFNK